MHVQLPGVLDLESLLLIYFQVCAMFSRIVDLHNFDRIMRKLAPDLARDVSGGFPQKQLA